MAARSDLQGHDRPALLFPYKSWFSDLYAFSNGRDFDEFLKKYPAHTAVIDLDRVALWKNFLQSKNWRVVFFGPTSAVFIDSSVTDDRVAHGFAADRFDNLRNGRIGLNVFNFALVIGDYRTAWKVLDEVQTRLAYQVDKNALRSDLALHNGYQLLASSNYDDALAQFEAAKTRPVQGWREPVILKLLAERISAKALGDLAATAKIEAALHELAVPMPP